VETRRRSRDVLLLGDGDEIAKMPKLHGRRSIPIGYAGRTDKVFPCGRRSVSGLHGGHIVRSPGEHLVKTATVSR
jgi:hypothetical protein